VLWTAAILGRRLVALAMDLAIVSGIQIAGA
jgi:hypothetical protein